MILTRTEFAQHFDNLRAGLANEDGPLWIPESYQGNKIICNWFTVVRPLPVSQGRDSHANYWDWCKQNIQGETRCFSSDPDNQQEWWGFTEYTDLPIWLLRWAR